MFKLGRVWSCRSGTQWSPDSSVCSVCCVRHLTGVGCFQDLNQILSSPPHLNWVTITTPHFSLDITPVSHKSQKMNCAQSQTSCLRTFSFPIDFSFIYFEILPFSNLAAWLRWNNDYKYLLFNHFNKQVLQPILPRSLHSIIISTSDNEKETRDIKHILNIKCHFHHSLVDARCQMLDDN